MSRRYAWGFSLAIEPAVITMTKALISSFMPNQRAIAASLGLNQTTVSLALRGHPRIPPATRERVRQEAERLGYRSSAYVSALMQHIRSGRPLRDKGCIAVIVDAKSEKDWYSHDVYRRQHESINARAEKVGYHSECFYLRAPGMDDRRINRILSARGIIGVIFSAPCRSQTKELAFDWNRYACVANGFTWRWTNVDIVANHQIRNVEIVWNNLREKGYTRIGMCLPLDAVQSSDNHWLYAYAGRQFHLPKSQMIPVMTGNPDQVPFSKFQRWYRKWKPDALICPAGHELMWVKKMGLRVPQDLAMAHLSAIPTRQDSGVEENSELLGSTLVDLVVGKIFCNEFGRPAWPKVTLIEGRWVEGIDAPKKTSRN